MGLIDLISPPLICLGNRNVSDVPVAIAGDADGLRVKLLGDVPTGFVEDLTGQRDQEPYIRPGAYVKGEIANRKSKIENEQELSEEY